MADINLRSGLEALFRKGTIVRRRGKSMVRTLDTSRIQSTGNRYGSGRIDRYGRLYTPNRSARSYNDRFNYQASRISLYNDYEIMDKDSIISSVLDIYADECTLKNDMGDIIHISATNDKIKKHLESLFYDTLNIEYNLWAWIRGMAKYGDYYLKLDIDYEQKTGIQNCFPLPVYETSREEGFNEDYPYEVRFKLDNNVEPARTADSSNYLPMHEVAHFRLLTDTNFLPYGRSALEGARKEWKRLTLFEDAMMLHRIMRAPEKRVFKIDIGNIPPNEVDSYMNQVLDQMKKVPYKDPNTGEYNLKFNLQNMVEDFYLPVRGGNSGTEIETLSGMDFGGIDDVEYIRNRMLAGLKVPKAFIGYEEGIEGKATLAQQDIRFARTIERIQRIFSSELTKIAIIHLYALGYRDEELVDFDLKLSTPSVIYEQEKLNIWSEKINVARDLKELKLHSNEWIYNHVFGMSDDEWKREQYKVINDLKLAFRQQQIEMEGNDPAKTGESFGTAHDIASMNMSQDDDVDMGQTDKGGSPEGGWDGAGRPKETGTYGKDKSNFGRDALDQNDKRIKDLSAKHKYKKSPLSTESLKNSRKVKSKSMILESLTPDNYDEDQESSKLLDENQLLISDEG